VTKAELERRAKAILALPVGTVLAGADLDLAMMLLERHPSRDAKIGPGVDHWVVRKNGRGNGHELRIVRIDGSEVDLSYRKALAPGTPAAARAEIRAALRVEITEQIVRRKTAWLTPGSRCAISGVALDRDSAHVDHVPPTTFAALAEAWLARHPDPTLEGHPQGGCRLADRQLAADWQFFHDWAARLRLIHKDVNAAIAAVRRHAA
jgi:hypothetical protein